MRSLTRVLIFLTGFAALVLEATAQQQDKEQSKLYMEQADLIMADTKAMDEARDIMVIAADFDTTNIKANFEAGHMHLLTINKDFANKFFLRIYRQDVNYRFDLLYWIGKSYQYALDFDNAIKFYTMYRDKLRKKPDYQGKDKVDMAEVERNLLECANGKDYVAHPKNFSITNIGSEINSEGEDYAPIFTEDGKLIVFTTRRRDGNTFEDVAEDNKPYEDIFTASKSGDNWTKATNIGPTVNTKYFDSGLALSSDGTTLFIYKSDIGAGDIYFSKRSKNGAWGTPEPLPGLVNSSYKEGSISISKDGNTLYFASERPGGLGGSDIYTCAKDAKGEWTRVKNLGKPINTEFDEDGPFIDYDGKTLYFSSKGGKGMGYFDIYKTTLISAEKNQWTDPENLGYPINTPDNDNYYVTSPDGKLAYYSAVRDDGFGYDDIYIIAPSEAKPPEKKEPEPVKPEVEKTFSYVVTVRDAETKSPLEATVKLIAVKTNTVIGMTSKGDGVYEFTIKTSGANDYRLSAEFTGYAFLNETTKIEGTPGTTDPIQRTVELKKLVVGVTSVLRNIYFDFARATFKQDSYSELNKLESMMKKNSSVSVEILGHTDNIGSLLYNKNLSQLRANAVASFLTSKGVDPRRVKAVGYGEEKPMASNDDEKEGRELNRRVEFKVIGN